jgi:hypothetical protein
MIDLMSHFYTIPLGINTLPPIRESEVFLIKDTSIQNFKKFSRGLKHSYFTKCLILSKENYELDECLFGMEKSFPLPGVVDSYWVFKNGPSYVESTHKFYEGDILLGFHTDDIYSKVVMKFAEKDDLIVKFAFIVDGASFLEIPKNSLMYMSVLANLNTSLITYFSDKESKLLNLLIERTFQV